MGKEFTSFSPENQEIMKRTRKLLDRYNATAYEEWDVRAGMLKEMLGSCGDDVIVQTPFKVSYGVNVHVGDHVFINYQADLLDGGEIRIGDRVMIGPEVKIFSGNHSLDPAKRMIIKDGKMEIVSIADPVVIGDDVWIGGNVTICPGVTVGNGCMIAAGSVVTKDVPEGCLAAGNPARVIRKLGYPYGTDNEGER
jgi:maltose O-acetyltransferase